MTIRKLEPQASAPRPATKERSAVPPRASAPAAPSPGEAALQARTGRTSSFEAFKPPPVTISRQADSEGRGHGTNDDSVGRGRGTNDDSVGRGRGTNDDSIGRGRGTNDDSIGRGRGTNDDSIGRGRGTNDDSIGLVRPPLERGSPDEAIGGAEAPPTGTFRGVPFARPERAGFTGATNAKLDALLTSPDNRLRAEVEYVVSTKEFQELPAKERASLVNVMSAGGTKAARAVSEIFEQSGGAMLKSVGNDGKSVLENLEKLAGSKDGMKVLGDVMFDLVNPGRIWQGRAPTCTVSTMQYELAQQDPGEYSRLMAGLAADGQVTMRGGGVLVADGLEHATAYSSRADRRSTSEALFQASAMEYANGADEYREVEQRTVAADGTSYRGLHGDQIRTMVSQLVGVDYETKQIGTDAEADAELQDLMKQERPNRPVLFDITIPGSQSNHCVALVDVRGDHVVYRDPTTGRDETMTKDEFRQSLASVHYAPVEAEIKKLQERFRNFRFPF